MANPTDNTLTPTGTLPLTNTAGRAQQFVVWSEPWSGVPSTAPWTAYLKQIPATGQNIA